MKSRSLTEREYLIRERAAAPLTVEMLSAIVQHATRCVKEMEYLDMSKNEYGYKEHEALLFAFDAGLDWFFNHAGGHPLSDDFHAYVIALRDAGFEGEVFKKMYEEYIR